MSEKYDYQKGPEVSGLAAFADDVTRGFSASFVLDGEGNVSSVKLERIPGFVMSNGRMMPVLPSEDGRKLGEPITATLLRKFRFADSLAAAKRSTRDLYDSALFGPPTEDSVSRLDAILDRRRGAGMYGDDYYAGIAAAYARLVADGSKSASAEIARELQTSIATARNHVRTARERGFLVPRNPGRGRQVGELTPKAIELLAEGENLCTGMSTMGDEE
jgi:hypothetical protein